MRSDSKLKQLRHVKSTRPFRLSVTALFEFLTLAQLIQTAQIPFVGIVTHFSFTASTRTPRPSRHSSRIRFPGDAFVNTSAGFVAVSTFSSSSFLFSRASCNQSPLNAVATASRVINDTLTVCRNCDTAVVPKIHLRALDSQWDRARRGPAW